MRSLCEEVLCTSGVGTWEKDRGWVATSASDASVRRVHVGAFWGVTRTSLKLSLFYSSCIGIYVHCPNCKYWLNKILNRIILAE